MKSLLQYALQEYGNATLMKRELMEDGHITESIGDFIAEISMVVAEKNRLYLRRYDVKTNDGKSSFSFILGHAAMLLAISAQKFRDELLQTEHIEGVATLKQSVFDHIVMPAAIIILNNESAETWLTAAENIDQSIDFFTIEEEKRFIEVAKDYSYYPQFRLILEMGLRTSEMIGLTWSCVSFEKKEITIEKTLEYRYSVGQWVWGPPKTKHGYRTLKLTKKAYEILKELYDNRESNPKTPEEFKDVVFINRTGYPTKNSTYDAALAKRCEKAGVKKLSMHDLRHTMATRFTEQSTDYKRLSKMLGHSSIKITVDTYVHETQDSIDVATDKFSNYLDELFD